jgi:hypothetical protein
MVSIDSSTVIRQFVLSRLSVPGANYFRRLFLVACRSKVVTDEGAFQKFISIAALHTATKHLPGPLTLSPRQATSGITGPGRYRGRGLQVIDHGSAYPCL